MGKKYLAICIQEGGDIRSVNPFDTHEQANDFIAKSAAEMYDKIHEKFTSGIDVWPGGAEIVDGEEVYSWQIYPLIDSEKTCKMNVVTHSYKTECTSCGHRFNTDYAMNQYREMCHIAKGKFNFCPNCGAKYIGCQIDGVDFDKCEPYDQDWIISGLTHTLIYGGDV